MDVAFTLSHIRAPMRNIGCSALVNMGVTYQGHLRRKRAIHNIADKLRIGSLAIGLFNWEMCYVVLHNGCLYVYKDERQAKPDKAFSLFGYTQVMRAGELRQKDVAWPFKIVYILDTNIKVHYFSAANEGDMKKWMVNVKNEMLLANNISYTDDSLSNDDYSDLETPVSTRNYFRSIKNLSEIQNTLGSDSDLEEYTYPSDSCLVNYISDDDANSPQQRTPPALPTRTTTCQPRQPTTTPVKTTAAAPSSSDHVTSTRRPLPPTPSPSSATTNTSTNHDVPATPIMTDKSTSHNDCAVSGHAQQQQQPRPATKPKPAVARKPQLPSSRAVVNRADNSSRTVDTAAAAAAAELSDASATGISSVSIDEGEVREQRESSHTYNDAGAAELSDIDDVVVNDRPSPPVPPTRQRHHHRSTQMKQHTSSSSSSSGVADNQTNGGYSTTVTDLEAAATWSGDPGEGNRLMMQLEDEGTYMLRSSVDNSSKTLLVVADYQLRKYRVHMKDNNYSLEVHFTHMFNSIHQLVSFYKENNLPNRQTKLSKPYSELMDSLPSSH